MTEPESPSALLERAAELIAERAVHFEDYRETWHSWPPQFGGPVDTWVYDVTEGDASQAGKQWVETMNPTVAPPLVEWLREAVFQYRDERAQGNIPSDALDRVWMQHPAVRFARVVLGEPENTP